MIEAKIGIAEAVSEQLAVYGDEVTEKVKAATEKIAREAKDTIASIAPKRTGKYAGSFRVRTLEETAFNKTFVIYNQPPFHTLAHLLEKGHPIVTKDKRVVGRSEARPHIKPTEKTANEKLYRECQEIIKEAAKK